MRGALLPERPGGDSLGPLGALSCDKNGHPQCGGFLLDPTRVGQDGSCLRHQARKLCIRLWLGQDDIRVASEWISQLAADEWVRKPNTAPPFGGGSALERMLSGQVADLYVVRQYLDAERG